MCYRQTLSHTHIILRTRLSLFSFACRNRSAISRVYLWGVFSVSEVPKRNANGLQEENAPTGVLCHPSEFTVRQGMDFVFYFSIRDFIFQILYTVRSLNVGYYVYKVVA